MQGGALAWLGDSVDHRLSFPEHLQVLEGGIRIFDHLPNRVLLLLDEQVHFYYVVLEILENHRFALHHG